MALQIENIHAQIRNILNQDQRFETPEVIDQNLFQACNQLYTTLVGADIQNYQPGRPVSTKGGIGINIDNMTALSKLIDTLDATVTGGILDLSANTDWTTNNGDLIITVNSTTGGSLVGCEWIAPGTISQRLKSFIKAPTLAYPCWAISGSETIVLYPSTVTSVRIQYIKRPTAPLYSYTINPLNGAYIFDPVTSVDVPFPAYFQDRLINATLVLMGVPTKDNTAIQVASGLNNR